VPAALGLAGEAAIEHVLHPFPKLDGNERLVLALDELAVPLKIAGVEPVAQDGVDSAHRHLSAALGIEQALRMRPARCLLQRNVAAHTIRKD
jgi:hypothetical protein